MKKLLILVALAAMASCARQPAADGFSADTFLVVALEYSGPNQLAGVNTFGPTPKAALCQRASAG